MEKINTARSELCLHCICGGLAGALVPSELCLPPLTPHSAHQWPPGCNGSGRDTRLLSLNHVLCANWSRGLLSSLFTSSQCLLSPLLSPRRIFGPAPNASQMLSLCQSVFDVWSYPKCPEDIWSICLIYLLLFRHSVMSNSATPWTAACQTSLSCTIFWSLLKLMFIESVMLFNHLILCHPVLLPSVFPSIRVFFNESLEWVIPMSLWIRWLKYWSFGIGPCGDYSGLISFRIDRFDLLADQGTLKSLL